MIFCYISAQEIVKIFIEVKKPFIHHYDYEDYLNLKSKQPRKKIMLFF